jgi:hypothetical protein
MTTWPRLVRRALRSVIMAESGVLEILCECACLAAFPGPRPLCTPRTLSRTHLPSWAVVELGLSLIARVRDFFAPCTLLPRRHARGTRP